jgi:hypothetical protein
MNELCAPEQRSRNATYAYDIKNDQNADRFGQYVARLHNITEDACHSTQTIIAWQVED